MKVRFSLSIEDDLEMGGHRETSHPQLDLEDEDIADNCFYDDDLVSLVNISFNVDVDQDPNTDDPLCGCDHQFNEIVVMPEHADLAFSKKYSIIFYSLPFLFSLTNVEVAIAFLLFIRIYNPIVYIFLYIHTFCSWEID